MNATAGMLEARLALVARVHAVELALAGDDHARAAATALVRGKTHALGNAVQIVQLSALELERRAGDGELAELVRDLRGGADDAVAILGELLAAAGPVERFALGPPAAPCVRAAVEAARAAVAARVDLACELADDVRTLAGEDELAALVIASVLDAADAHATRISLVLRRRTIAREPYIQLLRIDDRRDVDAASLPAVVDTIARAAAGEASLAPGREGLELAIELPGTLSPS